ncbi:MAG: SusC/RagA family TonB-linked outer membrane protein [Prolixibacteraceae bacterium]|jgi:TonB-linked SusC/RagA family outer membrane protein|nr:SusC/RagA family TonB-linked outer membrane protein [Prolixibacteraceae bacterium]
MKKDDLLQKGRRTSNALGGKIWKIMRLTGLFLLISFVAISAETYSQGTRFSFKMENSTLNDLFLYLEQNSGYRFAYNKSDLDDARKISCEFKNESIDQILEKVLDTGKLSVSIKNEYIIITSKENATGNLLPANQPIKTVSGRVTDSSGAPLPGVSVVLKGTTTGVITNVDGKYTLAKIPENSVLQFSFVGMKTQEVVIGNKTTINVTLAEENIGIEEVVAVGYGTQRKKDLTGAISQVKGDDIITPSTSSFDQVLQGKVAGVQITQTSGAPGGNVNVLVRGISSITGGNQPLYVVDGYPIGSGGGGTDMSSFGSSTYSSSGMMGNAQNRVNPLSSINPSDIESIEILKDASATAIYGSRGANGVIIITTKRGSFGKSQINVDVSYGIQEVAHKLDMLNSQEYAEFVAEGRDNAWIFSTGGSASDPNSMRPGSQQVRPEFRNPSSITTNTDWQDVIFRIAPVQDYQISANGGNDKVKYFISGGYFNQKGIVLTSDYQRFNLRSNIDAMMSDKVKIGSTISGSYGYGRFPNTEGHYAYGGILSMALAASPTIPVYDGNGEPYFSQADVTDGLGWLANPLAVLDGYSDNRKVADILFNNFIEYKISEGLTFKSTVGVKYGTNAIKLWRSSAVPYSTTLNYPATGGATKVESINWLNENTLTYKHIFKEKHNFDALIGISSQKDSYDRLSVGASNYPSDYVTYISAGIVNSGAHLVSEWSMLSLISRVNYQYDGKYLFTATIRRDGSSRFGKNNKWGNFPSFSVGYNISEEPFMKPLKFINNLKLRVSYGISGNNQIGNYTHIGLLSSSNYVENNKQNPGLVPSSLSNDDLTWEKSKQTNIGMDLGFFEDRISLTADIYKDHKTDLLLAVALPSASGFSSSMQNIGDIENKGIELGIQTVNVKSNKFEWTSNFTFSSNHNKVLKLATEGGRITNSALQITEVGKPIASFYLLHAIGVFMNSAELAGAALQHPKTQAGDLKFEDVNKDGKIDGNDKTIVGDPWPDYIWGFDNKFTYGNFTLGISLNGSHGADTYFQEGEIIMNGAGVQNQLADLSLHRWRSESNPGDGFMPRAIRNGYALHFAQTSHYLFDSSFTRIKNVNVSYRLPQSLVSRTSVGSILVYANVTNLFTFTDYPGYDPESSTAGDNIVNSGIDYLSYPLPRTYTFGIKLTF